MGPEMAEGLKIHIDGGRQLQGVEPMKIKSLAHRKGFMGGGGLTPTVMQLNQGKPLSH